MKRVIQVCICVFLLSLSGVLAMVPANATVNTRIPTATRFVPPPNSLQALVVKNTAWDSSYAEVESWWRSSAGAPWQMLRRAPGRVGYNGIKLDRHEGDGTTPAGMFPILWGFGTGPNPNAKGMTWHTFDGNDWWAEDSLDAPTYNTYQTSRPATAKWRTNHAEHLADFPVLYQYAWVIGFNRPRFGTRPATEPQPNLTAGSGIFFHVGTGSTAGCVAVPQARALSISQWLDPGKHPVILIGEDNWLMG